MEKEFRFKPGTFSYNLLLNVLINENHAIVSSSVGSYNRLVCLSDNMASTFTTMSFVGSIVTLGRILTMCNQLGDTGTGEWVHGYVIDIGMDRNVFVSTCWVEMYSKFGNMEKASGIFDVMSKKDNLILVHGRGYLYRISSVDGKILWRKEFAAKGFDVQHFVHPQGCDVINVVGFVSLSQFDAYKLDENHAIVSSSVGSEHYVGILSFVDKDQLEPGCAILLITTLFAIDFFEIKAVKEIEPTLKNQLIISTVLIPLGIAIVIWITLLSSFTIFNFGVQKGVKNLKLFLCVVVGLWAGLIIGFVTEYYTSNAYSPEQEVVDSYRTDAASNVIFGLARGCKFVIIPIFAIAISIFVNFSFAAMYGIIVVALGMLSTIATGLANDAYGPISDNAGVNGAKFTSSFPDLNLEDKVLQNGGGNVTNGKPNPIQPNSDNPVVSELRPNPSI